MKPALILLFLSMFCSLTGQKGHFMRSIWLAAAAILASFIAYSPMNSANKIIAWGFYSNQLSSWLVMLTFFISFLAMVVSTTKIQWSTTHSQKAFGAAVILISLFVSICFVISNLLWFYMFFEGSLIPMFFLVAGWGAYQERVEASTYMIMYTVGASLPFLLLIASCSGTLTKPLFPTVTQVVDILPPSVIWYSSMMAFLVKLPLYPFHLWLPKAHVEAPTAGSMILAGVMLKLGGFGLICSLIMFSHLFPQLLWVVAAFALWGGMMAMLHCILQVDLKSAIAYSSVAHMSLVIYGAVSMNCWGLCSSTMIMISHGLTSSGLFCLTHWVYDLTGARLLSVVTGLLMTSRPLSTWGIILLSANIPTPPWLSMVGEVMALPAIFSHESHSILIIPLVGMMYLSAVFSLSIFTELFQGTPSQTSTHSDVEKVAHLTLYAHSGPLLGMMTFIDKVC
uniref:NADH dehydrogenase subunit 4 n=1 Tax=Scurria scurra TaxID=351200 RepID=UPI001EDD622D|nr:NADH dehydrogenase subunit 4 [Scurria scurra]UHY95074.1 NADH dehydrogenase subunit 4 [Scurria scurra]